MNSGLVAGKLERLAVIDVRGADAAAFLHAQLCGDVQGLAAGKCLFTAWCSPKGRVIASFLLARADPAFRMFLCRDIADVILRRLGRFVLRSRVELVDRGADVEVAGLYGSPAPGEAPPAGVARAWDFAEEGGRATAALPGPGGPRWLLCAPPAAVAGLRAAPERAAGWRLEDIRTGIPWIGLALSEEFLPQELDLERLRGLSYAKGCYPGQEIVARVHARGRVKRGLRIFSAAGTPPAAGDRMVRADGSEAGRVLAAEATGNGAVLGLAVVDLAGIHPDTLRLGAPDGAELRVDAIGRD